MAASTTIEGGVMMTATHLPDVTLSPYWGFLHDQRWYGGELLEEGTRLEEGKSVVLDFYGFPQEAESCIKSTPLSTRILEMEGEEASQHHLERLLAEAGDIPAELRKFTLVATGTQWKDPLGQVCVACIFWNDGQWIMVFHRLEWLNENWDEHYRLVRVRK